MDMLRFPRGTRNDFWGSRKFLKIEFYFGNVIGGNGTFPNLRFAWYQKIRGSISGSKVMEVLRWQHQCSGRLRGSLQRVVAEVHLGGVRVWQRRQRVRAAHK